MVEWYFAVGALVSLVLTIALVLYVLYFLWRRFFLPWYEKRLYVGPIIEGTWWADLKLEEGEVKKHQLVLKQGGYRIKGRITCIEDDSEGQDYTIKGEFNNQILSFTYEIDDARRIECGSTTLMLTNEDKELKGYLVYYDDEKSIVGYVPCQWTAILSADE